MDKGDPLVDPLNLDSIPGSIIQNKYKIDRFLDEGSNG